MIHHSSTSYPIAASEAASHGRTKMETIIQSGLASAQGVIEQVQSQVPHDSIMRRSSMKFIDAGTDGYALALQDFPNAKLHKHALCQVIETANLPTRFVSSLEANGQWGKDLMLHNLNTIFSHGNGHRHLVRRVGQEVRGVVSDRFRRLDSRPLLDAFIGASQELGLVPIEGYALETKVRMRAVLPEVFEPLPNEVMIFGLEWGNSDFGDGGHTVALWDMRVACTNLAVRDEVLRQVHLGRRLEDSIEYSQRTYELDTKANASALRDVVRHAIGPDRISAYLDGVRQASEQEITGKDAQGLLKKALAKADADKALAMFESNDVVNLPAGNSVYRLSNAVSWIAQAKDLSSERKLDLQRISGQIMPSVKASVVEV